MAVHTVTLRPGYSDFHTHFHDDGSTDFTAVFTAPADFPCGDQDPTTFRDYPAVRVIPDDEGGGSQTTGYGDYGGVYLYESGVDAMDAYYPGATELKRGTQFVPEEVNDGTWAQVAQRLYVVYSSDRPVNAYGQQGDSVPLGNLDTVFPAGEKQLATVVAPEDFPWPISYFTNLVIYPTTADNGDPFRVPVWEWWVECDYDDGTGSSAGTTVLAPVTRLSGRQDGRGPLGSAPRMDTASPAHSTRSHRLGAAGSYDTTG